LSLILRWAKIHYCRDPFGNILELLEMSGCAGSRIRNLPGLEEEGVFARKATNIVPSWMVNSLA